MIRPGLNIYGLILLVVWSTSGYSQNNIIQGTVTDQSADPLEAVLVFLESDEISDYFVTDTDGQYIFKDLTIGDYTILLSHLGFTSDTLLVSVDDEQTIIELNSQLVMESNYLTEVEVRASTFKRSPETPLSLKTVGLIDIRKNPGSGSDIAKVMQILPGVATTTSFRNDLIIRGGAPSENSFYIDGIRVPTINHLSTQGASGGAISLLNADFITSAELLSTSFPASQGNALSSVFNFRLSDGNVDPGYRVAVGATNLSFDAFGRIGDKTSYVASIRRSYRQHILKLLGLAVFPVYNDALFKVTLRPQANQEISLLGIGAFDKFKINQDINDSEIQAYLVDNLPLNDQWNYTTGINYKYFKSRSVWTISASRSHLYNKATREIMNRNVNEIGLQYESTEVNQRLATEYVYAPSWGSFKIGAELTQRQSAFDVFNLFYNATGLVETNYTSKINYLMYGGHIQFSTDIVPDWWDVSAGIRIDGSNYASQLEDPGRQASPRIATSLKLTNRLRLNGSTGIYYQLPSDVTLGYAVNGSLINKNEVRYIKSVHYVSGLEYEFPWNGRFVMEIFRKQYSQYPFNTRENISQANEGGNYGVAGNSPIVSDGEGRAQGLELMYEQKPYKGWNGIISYTYSQSEFGSFEANLVPSSWDARHILNAVVGKDLGNQWQMGFNIRYQSAIPYTPFDLGNSALVLAWDINREGIRDYTLLNTQRGKSNVLVDFRVDKTWNYKWGAFTLYLDLENMLADADSQQVLVFDKTNNLGKAGDEPIILNPQDPIEHQRYKLKEIQNAEGVLIPTFGFILEF